MTNPDQIERELTEELHPLNTAIDTLINEWPKLWDALLSRETALREAREDSASLRYIEHKIKHYYGSLVSIGKVLEDLAQARELLRQFMSYAKDLVPDWVKYRTEAALASSPAPAGTPQETHSKP